MRTYAGIRASVLALLLVGCPKPSVKADDAGTPTSTTVDAAVATVVVASATPDAAAPARSTAASATKPSPSKSAAKAAAYTCKPGEVDNGEACFKPCNADKDCAKPMKCQQMMVANPNGGTSTAMTCQKP